MIRDLEVQHYQFPENITDRNYGSGYFAGHIRFAFLHLISDPTAKKWWANQVETVFGFPEFVRFSYKPSLMAMEKGSVKVKWFWIQVFLLFPDV